MGFLSNMMKAPVPGSRGAQFGSAMGEMAPLLFSMAQGLRSGQGAAAYAPQGLAAMMVKQERDRERADEMRREREAQAAQAAAERMTAEVLGMYGGGPSQYDAMAATGGPTNVAAGMMALAPKIEETAQALGMDPVDLATIISYETAGTFDPTKAGPTTQWGQHRGLIQFGEPQARQYGVNWNDPVNSQLGADGAVARYFRENGWQPGMGMKDAYSIVNAGAPGRYSAKDAHNGGAPGTVAEKVDTQMAGHRRRAMAMFPNQRKQPRLSPERAAAILSNPYASEAARNLVLSQFIPKEEEKPQIVKGADGYNYWVTSDGRSMRAVPGAKAPDTGWRTLTPDQAAELGYDPAKGPYQIGLSGENRGKVTTGSGQTINFGDQNPLSPGQKKVDEEFAPKYLEWITTGGADSNVNTAQIASVLGKLESGEQLTGPEVGYVPELFRALTNPDAEQARAQVEQVVQRNLREILGGQFAQMEGAQLIKRAYDQKLPPEYNAARLRALYGVLDHAAKAKASMIDYWNANNGTLAGYQGPRIPSVEDFYAAIEGATAQQGSAAMPTVTGMAARIDKFVESALNNEERRIFEELPAADQMTFLRRKGFK